MTQNQASLPWRPVAARSRHPPAAPFPKRGGHAGRAQHPGLCLALPRPAPNVLLTPSACCPMGSCLRGSRVASSRGRQGNVCRQVSPSCIPGWLLALPRGVVSAIAAGKTTNTTCCRKHLARKSRGLEAPVLDQPVLWVYTGLGVSAWEHGPTRGSLPPSIPPTGFAGARFCQVRHRGQALSLVQSNRNTHGALHAELLVTVDRRAVTASFQPAGEQHSASPSHQASSLQKCLSRTRQLLQSPICRPASQKPGVGLRQGGLPCWLSVFVFKSSEMQHKYRLGTGKTTSAASSNANAVIEDPKSATALEVHPAV